jgi:hypothetical protein
MNMNHLLIAIVWVVMGLVGCKDKKIHHESLSMDAVTIPRLPYTGGASDANANSGVIHVMDGCLYLKTANNILIYPMFATRSASFEKNKLSVDSVVYDIGDVVDFGGGQPYPISKKEWESMHWLTKPEDRCIKNNALVINAIFHHLLPNNATHE